MARRNFSHGGPSQHSFAPISHGSFNPGRLVTVRNRLLTSHSITGTSETSDSVLNLCILNSVTIGETLGRAHLASQMSQQGL